MSEAVEQARPLLRVVAGSPTAEELAVVVALFSRPSRAADPVPQFSLWSHKSRMAHPPLHPGFGAWRASTMPR
jgi:hypothetical protein